MTEVVFGLNLIGDDFLGANHYDRLEEYFRVVVVT